MGGLTLFTRLVYGFLLLGLVLAAGLPGCDQLVGLLCWRGVVCWVYGWVGLTLLV